MYADFSDNTWPKFLKELLNEDNFGFQRDIQGEIWATPAWTHCLEYEFQLRKEALRLCFEEGYGIQEALWSALADPQHRMKHWIQLLAVANSKSSSSVSDRPELTSLRRRIADLERSLYHPQPQRAIKGSSKGQRNKRRALAFQDEAAGAKGRGKGKAPKGKRNKGAADKGKGRKGKGKAGHAMGSGSRFDDLLASSGTDRFHTAISQVQDFATPSRTDVA